MQLIITDTDLQNPALAESLVVFIQHAARLEQLEGGDDKPAPITLPAHVENGTILPELAPDPVVAPPPPPFTPEEVDEHAGPQVAPVSGVDSSGLPWDEAIHSATKATNADGTWRRRRGVDDAVYNARVAELRGPVAPAPVAPAPVADTPFTPNDGFDAFARTGVVVPAPPPVPAPVVHASTPLDPLPQAPTPPVPPAAAAPTDYYVALIQKITREGITVDRYSKALAIGGLANLAAGLANQAGAQAAYEALCDGRA